MDKLSIGAKQLTNKETDKRTIIQTNKRTERLEKTETKNAAVA